MADVRSLLRQQRAARRIEHPHAAYSEAGKLLCTLCHEQVKSDSLWEGHIRSAAHRQRLQTLQATARAKANGTGNEPGGQPHKRKHDEDEEDESGDALEDDAIRKKRSKPDMTTTSSERGIDNWEVRTVATNGREKDPTEKEKDRGSEGSGTPSQGVGLTPPLTRRTSGTPVQGVEMQIPSRPATPVPARDGGGSISGSANGTVASAASTPKYTPVGRSPLIQQEATVSVATDRNAATATSSAASGVPGTRNGDIDEEEWAAFEAEMVHGPETTSGPSALNGSGEAVISAPAMTADEVAAQSEEEARAKRRALADIQMEDEKEEASRALETEFEEMEELEARVRKLKERREALRRQVGGSDGTTAAVPGEHGAALKAPSAVGKENSKHGASGDTETLEEDEEDDDDDEWDGFRFRA